MFLLITDTLLELIRSFHVAYLQEIQEYIQMMSKKKKTFFSLRGFFGGGKHHHPSTMHPYSWKAGSLDNCISSRKTQKSKISLEEIITWCPSRLNLEAGNNYFFYPN